VGEGPNNKWQIKFCVHPTYFVVVVVVVNDQFCCFLAAVVRSDILQVCYHASRFFDVHHIVRVKDCSDTLFIYLPFSLNV